MATQRSHGVLATDLQADDERRLRHVIAHFPQGITCSNRHFNHGMDGNDLKTHFKLYQNKVSTNGKQIASPKPYVRWKLVIETGRTRRTAPTTGKDNFDADLEKALRTLENLGL